MSDNRKSNVRFFAIAILVAFIAALFNNASLFPTVSASGTVHSKHVWGTTTSIYKGEEGRYTEVHCMGSALVANSSFVWYCIVPPATPAPVAEIIINNTPVEDEAEIDMPSIADEPTEITIVDTPAITVVDTPVVVVPPVVVIDPPVVVIPPVVIEEEKVHCNNGNGNGAEGCNASYADNANEDETAEKKDKVDGTTNGK